MPTRTTSRLGQVSDADLKLIRVFQAVAENHGFAAAASALGVSGSTISIHMTSLETRLGLKLCQRGRSGFALTREGKQVYEASSRLLASIEAFRAEVNTFHDELRGDLSIGITDNLVSLPRMRVTESLAAIKRSGPQVHLHIHMGPSGEVERGVIDGRFQAGVVPAVAQMAALEYIPLYDESVHLYCARNHPLFERKDETIDTVEIKRHDAVQSLFSPLRVRRRHQQVLNATATADDREGVAFLILTGRYIGFLPQHFAARWVDSQRMRALKPKDYSYSIPYSVVTRRGRLPNRVLERFLDEIKSRD